MSLANVSFCLYCLSFVGFTHIYVYSIHLIPLDDLVTEKLDLVIRLGNLKNSSLKTRKIGEYPIYLVATPQFIKDHPIENISDLADVPWIGHTLLNWQDSQYILQNSLGEQYALPFIRSQYESNSVTAIHQMALSSLGVAICPAWLVDEDIQNNRLIRLFPDFPYRYKVFNYFILTPLVCLPKHVP